MRSSRSLTLLFSVAVIACASCGRAEPTTEEGATKTDARLTLGGRQDGLVPASLDYSCTIENRTFVFPVTITGTPPRIVTPGSKVVMADFQATMTVPATAASELVPLGLPISGVATTLDVIATEPATLGLLTTRTSTETVNAAATPIPFGPVTLRLGQAMVLKLPASAATIGSWSALLNGEMTFTSGKIVLAVRLAPTTGTWTCTPVKAATIATTVVMQRMAG